MNLDHIYQGDSLQVLKTFPDKSINCCVTSPPYYGLRDYGVDGQIGNEETPEEYVSKIVAIFKEVHRVLTEDGTLWLNLGDSYAGSGKGVWDVKDIQKEVYVPNKTDSNIKMPKTWDGIKSKDLIGIPWMVAFALRNDGWYLRQDIIWYKPNCMPESVRDRCTKSHEYVFLLSKSNRYYFDSDAIKESRCALRLKGSGNKERKQRPNADTLQRGAQAGSIPYDGSATLRNKRDVWQINTKPCKDAHFAVFPPELAENCINAGCPSGGVTLDPFFGSGTVGVVAKKQGKHFVGIELNENYCTLASTRIHQCV